MNTQRLETKLLAVLSTETRQRAEFETSQPMKITLIAAVAATLLSITLVEAQTTVPSTPTPNAGPAATLPPVMAAPNTLSLSDAEVKTWIDKAVYSSDDKKIGEVAAFARDGSGKVTEMHADIGGFLGIGETRVRLMPAQFKMGTDRVVLMVTADQAKTLPTIKK